MPDPVVIIGAYGAIGSAIARRLAAAGRQLHLVGRDPDRLAALSAKLGGTTAQADVMDTEALAGAVQRAGPRVGGLAYCVGSIVMTPLKRTTAAEFIKAFRLNTVDEAMAVQAAAGHCTRFPEPASCCSAPSPRTPDLPATR